MKLKNEVMVGLVVIAGIVLLVIGAFWLSGRSWGEEQMNITASFQEVGDLREGNPVNYRGVRVGRVQAIQLGRLDEGVFVTMNVRADIDLPEDVGVLLSPESFFGDWQAQLLSRSQVRDLPFTASPREGVLPGAALPDISELTGVAARIADQVEVLSQRIELAFTEETAIQIRQAVGDISETTAQLGGFVDQQTETYRDVSSNVLAATSNIQDATGIVTRVAGELDQVLQEGDVQRLLSNVSQTSENLRQLSVDLRTATTEVPGMVARADTTMSSLTALAGDVSAVMQALEPQIEELGPTLADARSAMASLQVAVERVENGEGTFGRLAEDPALYEETQAAIMTLRQLMADVQASPDRYLRNIRLFGR